MIFFVGAALAVRAASGRKAARPRLIALTRGLSIFLLRVLNIRCHFEDLRQRSDSPRPRLILPNHASYLDVLAVNACFPSVFVTSREIEETPVLGWITRAAGCAFVERRRIWRVQEDVAQLAEILTKGYDVTLFPEGSTTHGQEMKPFKSTLLDAALKSRCQVVPVCLRYERVDGRAFDEENRDLVAWYGEMTFFPHLWRLMRAKSIDVRVTALPEISFRQHRSRRRLGREVQQRIAEKFHA